jgi:hypothetical protein
MALASTAGYVGDGVTSIKMLGSGIDRVILLVLVIRGSEIEGVALSILKVGGGGRWRIEPSAGCAKER